MNVAVVPGGRDVAVATPGGSFAYRLADLLQPGDEPPARLVALAELAANETLEAGTPVPMATADWLARWRSYRRSTPASGGNPGSGTP